MTRIVRDWTKLIVPKVNIDDDVTWHGVDAPSKTTDNICIFSYSDIVSYTREFCVKSATDFALMNSCYQLFRGKTLTGKKLAPMCLRSNVSSCNNDIYMDGFDQVELTFKGIGIAPTLSLKLSGKVSSETVSKEIGEIKEVRSKQGNVLYYTVEIGEYPKTKVSESLFNELESLFNNGELKSGLECTGRLFTTNGQQLHDNNFLSKQNPEFEYNGERYVRTSVSRDLLGSMLETYTYEDGTIVPSTGAIEWVKVEPITFKLLNFYDIITGEATTLDLGSEEMILAGIPFYPQNYQDNNPGALWQNSLIRAFINSANSMELDGNPDCEAPLKWDFSNSGLFHQAFDMTRQATTEYTIPSTENKICDYAFRGCVGLQKIIIPPHVTSVGTCAFEDCVNVQIILQSPDQNFTINRDDVNKMNLKYIYISNDGKNLVLSPFEDVSLEKDFYKIKFSYEELTKFLNKNYRENLMQVKSWREAGKIEFIPPEYTLQVFPSSEMDCYFKNNNNIRWGKLVKTLKFDTLTGIEKNNSLIDLMKIYYALGGFSKKQGESEKAFEYVLKYVATTEKGQTPIEVGYLMHYRFSRINLNGPYNPMFAKFFMKYYHENPNFMCFDLRYPEGEEGISKQDYLCLAHNSFNKINKLYPYRGVTGNEERALLTPRFVAEHSIKTEYFNVEPGNESLAETVGQYSYSQKDFEYMQSIYNHAKIIKDKFVLSADKAKGENGITFRILEKDDPLGFILGDITNCCQHIGGVGEACVADGYQNANAGFLVFEQAIMDENGNPTGETRILGQAYIWYDPETKTVCYDNIEIPTKVLNELNHGEKHSKSLSSKNFIDVVQESADAIMLAMNRKGIQVDRVTTGKGYNDLTDELEERFGEPEINPEATHRGYYGYSDAINAQYLIRTYDETTRKYAKQIRETVKTIREDLTELQEVETKDYTV